MTSFSLQILFAVLVGVANFAFTILRTMEKGPKLEFPSPYFTVVKNGNKFTLQGLITNKGDQPTMVYLQPPSLEIQGERHFASTIAARDLDAQTHLGAQFTLGPNEFREVTFAIDIKQPNSSDLVINMLFEYIDKYGKMKKGRKSISFIPETYENYLKFSI